MNKVDKAKFMFSNDYNCAQSVLGAYAHDVGIDVNTANRIALGFGAGMGRLQNTCGAITGAFMVLGLKYGRDNSNDDEIKERLIHIIQQLSKDFIDIHGSINCGDLLGCNINTDQGMAEAEEILPDVKTVTVKEAMGEFAARCYPPKLTAKIIYEAAKEVVQSPPEVKPLKFNGPIEIQIDLAESDYTEKLKGKYPKIFINNNSIQLNGKTVTEVWSKYCQIQGEVKRL